MSELNITSSAEKYLKELLENQEDETIGIKIFISEPGTPRAETCLAYCKKEDVLEELNIEENLIFKFWYFSVRYISPVMVGCVFLYFFA